MPADERRAFLALPRSRRCARAAPAASTTACATRCSSSSTARARTSSSCRSRTRSGMRERVNVPGDGQRGELDVPDARATSPRSTADCARARPAARARRRARGRIREGLRWRRRGVTRRPARGARGARGRRSLVELAARAGARRGSHPAARVHLPPPAPRRLRVRRRGAASSRTSTRSASPTSTSRPSSPPRPARRTATTSWTTAGSTPSSGGEAGFDRLADGLRPARDGHPARLRPEPHGHRAGEPLVDGRARERPVRRCGRRRSTWTGRRARPSSATRCSSRCSAISSGACSSAASSSSRARAARSWSATSTTSSRSRRARCRSSCGTPRRAARRDRAGGRPLPGARVDLRLAREARAAHRHLARGGRRPGAREGGREATPRRAVRGERPGARSSWTRTSRAFNGRVGEPRSFDLLERLLDAQAYRLAFWRVAGEEINYRRFFDVNGLAAIRMEEPARVRRGAPARPRAPRARGARPGCASTTRTASTRRPPTSAGCRRRTCSSGARLAATRRGRPLDAETEPVLLDADLRGARGGAAPAAPALRGRREDHPRARADAGGVGRGRRRPATSSSPPVNGLFVDPAAERTFDGIWARACDGEREDFRRRRRGEEAARHVLVDGERGEHARPPAEPDLRDEPPDARLHAERAHPRPRRVRGALPGVPDLRLAAAATWTSGTGPLVEQTIARARRRSPVVDPSIYDFLRDVLLQRHPEGLTDAEKDEWLEFTLKLQQVTGPVTAKAVEDTAFYTYGRLVSLNEVGGEPEPLRHPSRGGARAPRGAPRALSRLALGDLDARHEAERGRPRADRRPHRAPRRVAERGRALGDG